MTAFKALEALARIGFLVKGVLYLVVGTLALQVAARMGGQVTGTRGALVTVFRQPFGRGLLIVMAAGLLGYAAWRILQGILDPDREGTGWLALANRAGYVIRGVVHAGLGVQALRLYRGMTGGTVGERAMAMEAMRWPFGQWLVLVVGLVLLGVAAHQAWEAWHGRLERNLRVGQLRQDAGSWAVAVSRFGVLARAVIFAMFGWFLVQAGWTHDPSEVGTTATILRILGSQPGDAGRWLLGSTAAGLMAYGFYQIIHARYLHIRPVAG